MAASAPGSSGTPVSPRVPVEAVETVFALAGEALGEVALVFRQNVDSEVSGLAEVVDDGDRVAETDQHQRRIQGNGSEGTDGQSVGRALSVQHAGDGHAGCETPARPPELVAGHVPARRSLDMRINSILSCG